MAMSTRNSTVENGGVAWLTDLDGRARLTFELLTTGEVYSTQRGLTFC